MQNCKIDGVALRAPNNQGLGCFCKFLPIVTKWLGAKVFFNARSVQSLATADMHQLAIATSPALQSLHVPWLPRLMTYVTMLLIILLTVTAIHSACPCAASLLPP